MGSVDDEQRTDEMIYRMGQGLLALIWLTVAGGIISIGALCILGVWAFAAAVAR